MVTFSCNWGPYLGAQEAVNDTVVVENRKKRVFQRFKAWHGAENMIKYIFEEKISLGSFPDT